MKPKWLRAVDDTAGAAAVEFALVAAPFLLLVLAALQTMIIFLCGQAIQTVASQSARLVMTGQAAGLSQTNYKTAVCNNLPSMFDCSKVIVDMQSAANFTSLNTTPPVVSYDRYGRPTNTWSYSQGSPGDVVILRVMYNFPVLGGTIGLANQPNGTFLMIGTAVFKNEPYPT